MEAYISIFFLPMTVFLMASKAAVYKRKLVPLQTSFATQKKKQNKLFHTQATCKMCTRLSESLANVAGLNPVKAILCMSQLK